MIYYLAHGGTRFSFDPDGGDVSVTLEGGRARSASLAFDPLPQGTPTVTVKIPAADLQEFVSQVLQAKGAPRNG
jgi:hypothetical protein